jgi:SAM-dependent methyltransferase
MLRNWRVKGTVQKVLASIPGGTVINDELQRTVGELRHFEATVDNKVVDDWIVLLELMLELGISPSDQEYLEIGTGWFPTLPVCFSLIGARSIKTYDLHRHVNSRMTLQMIHRLGVHLEQIAAIAGMPLSTIEAAYSELCATANPSELFQTGRIEYCAPADASRTHLADSCIDVVFSNSVLEHIVPETIDAIMLETARILKPGGVAIHSVNCGDHYAYFDRGITAINYLQYSERQWAFWNNRLGYQNRLRASDFLRSAEKAGLRIILSRQNAREDLFKALPTLVIAPQFKCYSIEDLCCTSIDFVVRK